MKFDTNIWQGRRDLSSKPTIYLVGVLSKSASFAAMLGLVAGACFAFAWRGGTEHTHSWQFIVFGSMALFGIGVGLMGDRQLNAMIQKRIGGTDKGIPSKASDATLEPAPGANSSAHQG